MLLIMSKSVLLYALFKSFIVFSLTFKSLIHLEFIFMYGISKCSSFIFFTSNCLVFPAPLIEEIVFSPLYILNSFVKNKVSVCLIAQSCLTLCNPMECSPPGSSVHGDSPGKNTGVGCHTLLQGIFSTQRLNTGLPHCRWIIYHLSHQRSARYPQVSFIFGLSILFHLSIYLFLSQYHTVLMTVAL